MSRREREERGSRRERKEKEREERLSESEGDFFIVSKQFFKIIAICRRQI